MQRRVSGESARSVRRGYRYTPKRGKTDKRRKHVMHTQRLPSKRRESNDGDLKSMPKNARAASRSIMTLLRDDVSPLVDLECLGIRLSRRLYRLDRVLAGNLLAEVILKHSCQTDLAKHHVSSFHHRLQLHQFATQCVTPELHLRPPFCLNDATNFRPFAVRRYFWRRAPRLRSPVVSINPSSNSDDNNLLI